jgi:hypothetical protein
MIYAVLTIVGFAVGVLVGGWGERFDMRHGRGRYREQR